MERKLLTDPEFKELLSSLRAELPETLIKTRPQGGANIPYIEWTTASDVLDTKIGRYSVDIGKATVFGEYFVVEVGITIDGERRCNVGSEKLSHKGFGDPFTNAYAQAFKRAAASWGIARTLYQDEDVQDLLKRDELRRGELVTLLIAESSQRGYTDEALSNALVKLYQEPNPFRLSVEDLIDAITRVKKKPIIAKEE